MRVIISGGGTGGHIFPAVSIANKLKELNPETEILFVGAEGKMEMEKVPAAGYRIVGLPIVGLQRQLNLKNILNDLSVPFKVVASVFKARRIIKEFKPQIAIGVGGYASAPLLWAATGMGIPSLIQEQNGFAGLTNKKLGGRVQKICVAYEGMERFFPADKIVMTGNPIRGIIVPATREMKEAGVKEYGLDPSRKHIFVVGGSLGSSRFNQCMRKWISDGCPGIDGVDVLWQCGKYYKKGVDEFMAEQKARNPEILRHVHHTDFVGRMELAYAAADVVGHVPDRHLRAAFVLREPVGHDASARGPAHTLEPADEELRDEHHDDRRDTGRCPEEHRHQRRQHQSQRQEDTGVAAVGNAAHQELRKPVGNGVRRERDAQVTLVESHFDKVGHGQREVLAHEVVTGISDEDADEYLQPQPLVLFVYFFRSDGRFVFRGS